MQQIFQLQHRKRFNILPKPFNNLIIRLATSILHILLKILQINFLFSVDDHIQFLRLEDREKIRWYDFIDAVSQIID